MKGSACLLDRLARGKGEPGKFFQEFLHLGALSFNKQICQIDKTDYSSLRNSLDSGQRKVLKDIESRYMFLEKNILARSRLLLQLFTHKGTQYCRHAVNLVIATGVCRFRFDPIYALGTKPHIGRTRATTG